MTRGLILRFWVPLFAAVGLWLVQRWWVHGLADWLFLIPALWLIVCTRLELTRRVAKLERQLVAIRIVVEDCLAGGQEVGRTEAPVPTRVAHATLQRVRLRRSKASSQVEPLDP